MVPASDFAVVWTIKSHLFDHFSMASQSGWVSLIFIFEWRFFLFSYAYVLHSLERNSLQNEHRFCLKRKASLFVPVIHSCEQQNVNTFSLPLWKHFLAHKTPWQDQGISHRRNYLFLRMRTLIFVLLFSLFIFVSCKKLTLKNVHRQELISRASIFLPNTDTNISSLDPRTGPKNRYHLTVFQNLSCAFVEPNCEDPQGGGTPKFLCNVTMRSGNVNVLS